MSTRIDQDQDPDIDFFLRPKEILTLIDAKIGYKLSCICTKSNRLVLGVKN
jgi:hypothetical protein